MDRLASDAVGDRDDQVKRRRGTGAGVAAIETPGHIEALDTDAKAGPRGDEDPT